MALFHKVILIALLVVFAGTTSTVSAFSQTAPPTVAVHDLVTNPALYEGKSIQLYGYIYPNYINYKVCSTDKGLPYDCSDAWYYLQERPMASSPADEKISLLLHRADQLANAVPGPNYYHTRYQFVGIWRAYGDGTYYLDESTYHDAIANN
jgi:hypothetical protein